MTGHFYGLYLGDMNEMSGLRLEYGDEKNPDLLNYKTIVQKRRMRMEADTARQRVICLTDQLRGPWQPLLAMDTAYAHKIPATYKELMVLVSNDTLAMRDTLDNVQDKYKPKDFHHAAFKIGSSKTNENCSIGEIGFSKVFFNSTRDKAILYYEFYCSGNCGKGELLMLEYIEGAWKIKTIRRIWIS